MEHTACQMEEATVVVRSGDVPRIRECRYYLDIPESKVKVRIVEGDLGSKFLERLTDDRRSS